jgi:hypothetical protein
MAEVVGAYSSDLPGSEPGLWERLARLRERCNVSMVRETTQIDYNQRRAEREWRVRIELSRGGGDAPVERRATSMADALVAAIAAAEARGWHTASAADARAAEHQTRHG